MDKEQPLQWIANEIQAAKSWRVRVGKNVNAAYTSEDRAADRAYYDGKVDALKELKQELSK